MAAPPTRAPRSGLRCGPKIMRERLFLNERMYAGTKKGKLRGALVGYLLGHCRWTALDLLHQQLRRHCFTRSVFAKSRWRVMAAPAVACVSLWAWTRAENHARPPVFDRASVVAPVLAARPRSRHAIQHRSAALATIGSSTKPNGGCDVLRHAIQTNCEL